MDEKTKKEMLVLVGDVVKDVITPQVIDLEKKMDTRFDMLETRIDRIANNQVVIKNRVDEHERQIKKLPRSTSISQTP